MGFPMGLTTSNGDTSVPKVGKQEEQLNTSIYKAPGLFLSVVLFNTLIHS